MPWWLLRSLLCQNNDSLQWPVASEFFLMCVDMNRSASGLLQQPQVGCSALVSYETPGRATPTVQGQYPKICRVLVNVFIVSVFPALNIQFQFFLYGQTIPQGFCDYSWLCFFLACQRCASTSVFARSARPSTKRLPVVLYQLDAASPETCSFDCTSDW